MPIITTSLSDWRPFSDQSFLEMSTENEDRGPHWALKKVTTKRLLPNPTSVEVHEWVMPSCCFQHKQQLLRHGHLLRWMDVAACLSGELLTKFNDNNTEYRSWCNHSATITTCFLKPFEFGPSWAESNQVHLVGYQYW